MFESLIIGIGGMIFLMILWGAVQSLWGKTFSDYMSDEDVLADRSKCSNCHCATVCKNRTKQIST